MTYHIGKRLSYAGERCTVRYIGEVKGTKGDWLGVEWDDATRGKHAGEHNGVRYFECLAELATAGSFVRPSRPSDRQVSVIEAVREKYASGLNTGSVSSIRIGGKEVEEVGFEKIQQQMSDLAALRIVVLDGLCISGSAKADEPQLSSICPHIEELDLSRNLLEDVGEVLHIIGGLEHLKSLKIDGNRFSRRTSLPTRMHTVAPYSTLQSLHLEDTLLTLDEIEPLCFNFPTLSTLSLAGNQLRSTPPNAILPSSIKILNLERNLMESLTAMTSLTKTLPNLGKLNLKHNNIRSITSSSENKQNVMSTSLSELDVSFNEIVEWAFVDSLPTTFPGLKSLRISHNKVYESEDAFTSTVARIRQLEVLNHSTITPKERLNAETFYLSQIARELSSVPTAGHEEVLAKHPRYDELCKIYGAPELNQRIIQEDTLAAKLARCDFIVADTSLQEQSAHSGKLQLDIPKSFTIYNVQGILAQKLGLAHPMRLKLLVDDGRTEMAPRTRTLGMWVESSTIAIRVECR